MKAFLEKNAFQLKKDPFAPAYLSLGAVYDL